MRDINLGQLGVGDVFRALRQNLFVSEVLPFAVALLNHDVLTGERYDGELIVALSALSSKYWQENASAACQAAQALAEVKKLSRGVDLLRDTLTLANVLGEVNKERG